jgi:hypothetical protein
LNFKGFIKNEGLRKLATTKLTAASFSICIYLFNEILSGVEEIIASRKELSIMLGWSEKEICDSLDELQFCNIIHFTEVAGKPLRIRANLNCDNWNVAHIQSENNLKKNLLGDATNLHSLVSTKNKIQKKNFKLVDLKIFDDPIPFPKRKLKGPKTAKEKTSNSATSFNDLGAFREKNEVIDSKIKSLALTELDQIKHEKRPITTDEELLLQILSQHHQPKRQLILALRSNLIYPNLKFFLATAKMTAGIPDVNKK